jgi:hypothetical protein
MRRTVLTAVALVASSLVVGQPASAMEPLGPGAGGTSRAKLTCETGVVGVDSTRHVRYATVKNDEVVNLSRSKAKLPSDVTAWGYYDSESAGGQRVLRLDAVTSKGPRRIAITFQGKKDRITGLAVSKYGPTRFKAREFADGAGYFGYVVKGDKLVRWSLTRYSDGAIAWARPLTVRTGFKALRSLTATAFYEIKGVQKEVLYGTFEDGSLVQIQVPFKNPGKTKVRTLARSGYEGVREMSMSICNGTWDFHSIVAIDPVANTATWTTIKDITGKAKATLHGPVTGGEDWNLSAAY